MAELVGEFKGVDHVNVLIFQCEPSNEEGVGGGWAKVVLFECIFLNNLMFKWYKQLK